MITSTTRVAQPVRQRRFGVALVALLAVAAAAAAPGARAAEGETRSLHAASPLTGGPGNDVLRGGARRDALQGLGGNDRLGGGAESDNLNGGPGNDTLDGGNGPDHLVGGPGADTIKGGAGKDRVIAADGEPDSVNCGAGKDSVKADEVDVLRGCETVELVTVETPQPETQPSPQTQPGPQTQPVPPPSGQPYGDGVLDFNPVDENLQSAYDWTIEQFAKPLLHHYWANVATTGWRLLNAIEGIPRGSQIYCNQLAVRDGNSVHSFHHNAMYCAPADGVSFGDGRNDLYDYIVWDISYMRDDVLARYGDMAMVLCWPTSTVTRPSGAWAGSASRRRPSSRS